MKKLIQSILLLCLLSSCKKDKPASLADKFVGSWTVIEAVFNGSNSQNNVFNSTSVKLTDSLFALSESSRTPVPNYIYLADYYDYRTIYFQPNPQTRELTSTNPLCTGKYSANMDTLDFEFNIYPYRVRQKWIRQ
jgi:hypothetical protein